MKLFQLNTTSNWGSTGKIAEQISLAAMQRGWTSMIGYGRYDNPSKTPVIKTERQADVYLHYARHILLDGEGLGSKRATRQLIRKIDEFQPDVVHIHNIHDHWLNYPLLFDYLGGIDAPIVWTLHDFWPFTGGCAHFEPYDCYKWKKGCHHCPERRMLLDRTGRNYMLRQRYFLPIVDRLTFVAVSKWIVDYARQSFLSEARMEVIHNGIDLNSFKPSAEKNEKPMLLGVAAPWTKRKGLDDMLRIREMLPKEEYDMVLVGLSRKQLSSLPAGITGIERTSNVAELAELYSRASVLLNPTYSDSFPTVNLEAMACGTPIVTYRTGGSPEAVSPSTGRVVEQGDMKGMAEAAIKLIGDSSVTPQACVERARECFDSHRQFAKYTELYDDLLRNR